MAQLQSNAVEPHFLRSTILFKKIPITYFPVFLEFEEILEFTASEEVPPRNPRIPSCPRERKKADKL